jgi:WD40 repeat protein
MKTIAILSLFSAVALCAGGPSDRTLAADAAVRSISFSQDGKTLVASYADRHVRTWDVDSGKPLGDRSLGGLLVNSSFLVQATDPSWKSARVWDLAADRERLTLKGPLSYAAMSPDRKQLAVSLSEERSVQLLNPETGEQRHVLSDGLGGAATLAFSPDGLTLVSANYDNDVRIWKTQSGELVRKIESFTGAMFAAAFTPDGTQLVMGGLDETVYIFDAKTYGLKRALKGHGETILALAISPDGRMLVTGGFDVTAEKNPVKLVFWDLEAGTMTRTVRAPHAVSSLAFSADGHWLAMAAIGSKEISLFSLSPTTR